MAAIYINAKKRKGYLQRLTISSKMMALEFQDRMRFKFFNMRMNNEYEFDMNQTEYSNYSKNEEEDLDPTILWKKLVNPKELDIPYVEKIKSKIKMIDTITAIVALVNMILLTIEYDKYYFPSFYLQEKPLETWEYYPGQSIRILFMLFSCVLVFLSYNSCSLLYKLKSEQKKSYASNLFFNL